KRAIEPGRSPGGHTGQTTLRPSRALVSLSSHEVVTSPMPDEELSLLRRIAAGDRKAFETLYHLYYRRLFAYLFKVTRRGELVEEVLNDVMFAIWTSGARFDGRSRPSTWIFGIAYHKALKALSRQAVGVGAEAGREAAEPATGDGPESLLTRREVASTLGKALGALSAEQRAVVELTYY